MPKRKLPVKVKWYGTNPPPDPQPQITQFFQRKNKMHYKTKSKTKSKAKSQHETKSQNDAQRPTDPQTKITQFFQAQTKTQ